MKLISGPRKGFSVLALATIALVIATRRTRITNATRAAPEERLQP
jgi:hypothetical protein